MVTWLNTEFSGTLLSNHWQWFNSAWPSHLRYCFSQTLEHSIMLKWFKYFWTIHVNKCSSMTYFQSPTDSLHSHLSPSESTHAKVDFVSLPLARKPSYSFSGRIVLSSPLCLSSHFDWILITSSGDYLMCLRVHSIHAF